jgi:hypothetical protein
MRGKPTRKFFKRYNIALKKLELRDIITGTPFTPGYFLEKQGYSYSWSWVFTVGVG